MSSADVRAHEESLVLGLWGEGLSIRQIAKRVGFSRPKVDRILARIAPRFAELPEPDDDPDPWTDDDPDPWTDDDDDGEALALPDDDPERVVVPPLTYVGTERRNGRVYARWVDSVGAVDELAIWRYKYRNGSVADHEFEADIDRQLAAAGWWRQDHYDGCYQTWEPPPG